ncbi:MAG: hypothetical protein HON65_06170 [Rhodospirillales bacterium]|jgi:hypothetical protein|nr:hypothetical protein [Rhodospirillales bacterium]
MSATQLFSTINYITSILKVAESKGVHLEIGNDFTTFCNFSKIQPQKGHAAPLFDPEFSSVSPANGFWVKGVNDKDEIIHTQAARLIDLSGITLSDHLRQYLKDYRPHGDKVDSKKSSCYLSPASSKITGKLCYHGELWLKSGRNNLGGSLTAALTRLVPAMSSLLWSPDYFFGIMEPHAACKGLLAREGYTHLEQGSIFWHQPNKADPLEEWLAWMTQEDLEHLMRVPPENFDSWYTPVEAGKKHTA